MPVVAPVSSNSFRDAIACASACAFFTSALFVSGEVSPAENSKAHLEKFKLPLDACDLMIYTGFGLKGRNVVLVRSCDIVLFIAGAMGSLNEFTIANDEGKIIGCLTGTGGVADESDYLLQKFGKKTSTARVFTSDDPEKLLSDCLGALR